jgi:hypothetical protein
MNKIVIGIVMLLVGLGLGFAIPHGAKPQLLGGGGLVSTNPTQYVNGFSAGSTAQSAVSSTGAVTSTVGITTTGGVSSATYSTASNGTSSTTPAALGSASAAQLTFPTGSLIVNASTTAITANSEVFFSQISTSTAALLALGVTCNTAVATTSPTLDQLWPGLGFRAKIPNAPVTNPYCYSVRILN